MVRIGVLLLALLVLAIVFCLLYPHRPAPAPLPPPVPSDGVTDATGWIQRQLDAAGKTGGQVVLPPGLFLLKGHLQVPAGVALRGSWSAPHDGKAWNLGTTLLVTGGRGDENATPAVTLAGNADIDGFTFVWPEQTWNDIQPYPWAIFGTGAHDTVENVTFVNAYEGIRVGAPDGSLHLLRNIFGCVLRRGIFVDNTFDIGRLENIHFNPHYWVNSRHPSMGDGTDQKAEAVHAYTTAHLEAFIFGRTDWEYSFNTFVWGARVGYHFIKSAQGGCDGQFLGMGADYCRTCVQIDALQPIGLQITNGQFTAFAGDPGTDICTAPGAGGVAQLVNCTFYATTHHDIWMKGDTGVTLFACHFHADHPEGSVLVERGRLIVQGCMFDHPGPAVILQAGAAAAAITGNLEPGGLVVRNGIGTRARIADNEAP
jgi:hypothetical protein